MSLREQVFAYWRLGKELWERQIWIHDRVPSLGPVLGRVLILVARTLYIVISGFRRERIKLRAAALTYTTLLSLVPALAVGFSLFTAFGGLSEVEGKVKAFVVDALAVSQRELVLEYLNRFIDGTSAGGLGAVGTAVLFFTVVSLLANIERAFNDIWGVMEGRGLLRRFQVYWPLLTLGPILLGVSFSLTTAITASDTVRLLLEQAPFLKWFFSLGPLLFTCAFFTLLYLIMPNTKVKLSSAAIGGLVAGSLWVLAQKLYALYASTAITYSAIYGSLGAVPLFIIWIYVSWIMALLGATLSFAVQSARSYEPDRPISWAEREQAAARLVAVVAEAFQKGEGPVSSQSLSERVLIPPRLIRTLLSELVEARVLAETIRDGEDGYVPARPLEQLSLADLSRAVRGSLPEDETPLKEPERKVIELMEQIQGQTEAALARHTLDSLQ